MHALEADIAVVAGLDRYETVTWLMIRDGARGYGLRVRGRAKAYAPPFMMLGMNLENTTSSDFRITATARYLAFDTVGSGSEWRIDGTVGSDPTLATELYRPIGPTPLFVAPYAGIGRRTFNVINNDAVIARYRQTVSRVGLNVGVNLGLKATCGSERMSDARRRRSRWGIQDFQNCGARRRGRRSSGAWTHRIVPRCPAAGCSHGCSCRASSTVPTSP
jgi:NTE family protein